VADVNANIGIHIDTSQSLAEIKNLQRQLAQLYTSINKGSAAAAAAQKGLATNLMNTINAGGKFYAQMGTIRTSTESFTHALEKNKLTMREYFRFAGGSTRTFGRLFKSEFDTIGRVAEERVKKMQTQYVKLGRDASGAMRAISVTPTTLNMKEYGNQVAVAAQKQALLNQLLRQGSTNLLNFGKNTQWAGRQLMVGFTIPLAYFGTAAAKTFMDLEAQALKFRRVYGDMFTTTEQTNKALADIEALAKQFTKYGVAVSKTMEMAASAAAMGRTGAELTAQVAQATRLAVLGNVEQDQALLTTISLTDAFGLAAEDLAGKINFLNSVENQTITAIEDLTIAIPKAGPVVKQLGGSVEDLAFFLTAMREGGINASEGANALKSGLASLINPTEKAAAMLADMGINIKGIVEANVGNLKQTVIDFANALDTLAPLERSRAIEQLFGKFQFARLSTLFENVTKDGGQAARVLDLASKSVEELAILSERELGAVEDAIGTNFREAVEQLKLTIAPIGKEFLKAITPVIKFFGELFEKFGNLSDGSKKFIVILTTLVGLVGPTLLMTFGLVANGAANIIKLFLLMRQGFLKLTGNSTNLAQQTQYLSSEQMEAAVVAASLNQAHTRLTQQFTLEASAVNQLRNAYVQATAAAARFAAANPGMMIPGAGKVPKKFNSGTMKVPGYSKGTDSVPAMLTPGEAVIPEPIAQDDRFKPLIAALVSGEIAKYEEGTVNVGGKTYTTKSQMAARNLEKKIAQLIAAGISEDKIIRALDKNIERGRPMTGSALEKRLSIGRGSSAGTSAPSAIKRLAKESQSGFRTEVRAIKKVLKQKGITLTPAQEKNLFAVQASHIEEVRNAGIKQWNASNLVADLGYVNNYLNTVKGNLGKNLLAMSDDQLKTLGIDRDELRALQSGRHPTTARAAETLRSVARYDASINPRSYQAQAVLAGLEYRSKSKFYAKPLQTLADVKKTPATLAVGRGETVRTADGRLVKVTGQTGIAKPSGMRVVGGGASDRRVISGANVASVISRGFKGPRLVGAGAQDGIDLTRGVTYGQTTGGLLVPQSALEDALNKNTQSQNLGTDTQDKNTDVQEKTAKQLKQEERQARMQRMSSIGGPVAMAAGTAGMVAAMSGAPQIMTNFLFGISAVAGLLPLLANPVGLLIAAVAAVGLGMWKLSSDLKKAREEGIALAKSMTMSSEKVEELGKITGKVSATQIEDRKRKNLLSGGITEPQRQSGQNILQSEFGKGLLQNVKTLSDFGMDPKQVAQNISTQLGQAILQGVIDVDQAAGIASALGEQLGSYEIPLQITGNINQIFGPDGQNLKDSPLQVALEIKKESIKNQVVAFESALANKKSSALSTGIGVAGGLAGLAAVTAATGGLAAPAALVASVGLLTTAAIQGNKIKAHNLKLDTAAIQLGVEAVAQGQDLIDSVNRQYDDKIRIAKTQEEINKLEDERKAALVALNAENAKTLQILVDQKDQLSAGAFDAAIKASVDAMYKEGPMVVFKDQALEALKALKDSDFKAQLQLAFASGDVDPLALTRILSLISGNENIQKNLSIVIETEGFAKMAILSQLLDAASSGDQVTYDILLNYINTNEKTFDEDLEAVRRIADFKGAYNITLDMKTNGQQKLQVASTALGYIENLPDKLTKQAVIAANVDGRFNDIVANFEKLSEGKDSISKNLIVNYKVGAMDQNLINAATAANMGVPEYVARGFVEPAATVIPPVDTGLDKKKGRDTTLDELLKRLKFIRKASIDAQGGVKELMRITGGKGLKNFGGVMQQLMAGPRGGANREFISFLEGMDNATRKTYMTVKNGEVILTKQGKALKEAFNEKVIGEYQVANRQALQDTKAQGAALLKLQASGVDSATALEMVADANLAVAINSKNITGKELRQMAKDAKAAKDEVKNLNLEVLVLAEDLKKKVVDAGDALKAVVAARQSGIVDPEMLKRISQNQELVTEIVNSGMSPLAKGIIESYKAMDQLGEMTEGVIDPAKAAMDAFDKLKEAADKVFDRQSRQAQVDFENSMKRIAGTVAKLPAAFASLTIEGAINKANEDIDVLNREIDKIQYRDIRPLDIQIEAAESAIDDIMKGLETQAAGMQRGFNLPAEAYKDVAEGLRDKINRMELDLEFNPNYGARFIEKLQDQISDIELEIELNFSRPIADLQEESSDLSNDLTLMDRIADQINSKYDAQAEALQKISDLNTEISQEQKGQLDLADALSRGDVAAAARAAQEMRAQAAANAKARSAGVIEAARKAELGGVRSAAGLTREQIQERQFEIAQQVYQLEEQSEARQRSIVSIQDQIRGIEEVRTQKQREIRDIQDQISAGERARDAFIRANVVPLETQIKDLQEKRQGFINDIKIKEGEILKIQNEILAPLEIEVAGREKILKDQLDAIDAQRDAYDQARVKLEEALVPATEFANQSVKAETAFTNAKNKYEEMTKLGPITIRINEIVTRTVVVNEVKGSTVTGTKSVDGRTVITGLEQKMYGGKIKGYMGGGKVRKMYMAAGGAVGSDTVPAMLTPGEYVVNKASSKAFAPFLNAINESKYPSILAKNVSNARPIYQIPIQTSLSQPSYDISSPVFSASPTNIANAAYNDNSSAVYNYSVGISVGGTNASPDTIAKAVMNEIKYLDSQRVRNQKVS
jgi:TP901 family phage tail tape measure protein